ncbi:hypothetical protein [Nonomuraea endophytica]|uniref:hypothetical protein n=1 Tax=Nonomuraea endophytica TaxID=714136 RepID=UPI0037C89152
MITSQRPSARTSLTITYVWLAGRVFLLVLVLDVVPLFDSVNWDVSGVYQAWRDIMRATGSLPVADVTWQYPPAAALLMMAPSLLPFGYLSGFMAILLACDALVTVALARLPERAGVWVWLVGVPLLGPVVYARYDLAVTALAVLGLLHLTRSHPVRPSAPTPSTPTTHPTPSSSTTAHPVRSPRLVLVRLVRSAAAGGLIVGVAAALKLWPALILLGVHPGGPARRALLGAAAGVAVSTLAVLLVLDGGADFITAQRDRGVEVESVWAMPFHVARWLGWPGVASSSYGSMEMIGPGVVVAGRLSMGATILGLAWLVLWRVRARVWTAATPYDAAMAAVLLFVVTSRVISPQYLVWLVGLAALCVTVAGTTQRPVVVLVLAATAVTMIEFPNLFQDVVHGTPLGVAVLAVRNGLLVAATLVSCRRLWRAARGVPDPSAPG